jgi:hypothetical protein
MTQETVSQFQYDLSFNIKKIIEELDKINLKMEVESKYAETPPQLRKFIDNDQVRIGHLRKAVKELEIMTGFYSSKRQEKENIFDHVKP